MVPKSTGKESLPEHHRRLPPGRRPTSPPISRSMTNRWRLTPSPPDAIRGYLSHALDTRASATAHQRYASLVQLFRWLHREGEIEMDPMAGDPPKVEEMPIPVLSDIELRKLLAACDGKGFEVLRDAAILRLSSTPASAWVRCRGSGWPTWTSTSRSPLSAARATASAPSPSVTRRRRRSTATSAPPDVLEELAASCRRGTARPPTGTRTGPALVGRGNPPPRPRRSAPAARSALNAWRTPSRTATPSGSSEG